MGAPPSFPAPAKSHWEIGETLGILDFDRDAKIAGARFAVLTGAGALLGLDVDQPRNLAKSVTVE